MKKSLNIKRLRLMVDDPAGDDEMFSDEDYIEMYKDHESIYCLAAEVWLLKAAELQSASSGGIKGYKVGDESYDMTELKDLLGHAMVMRDKYTDMCASDSVSKKKINGSLILKVKRPDVL